MIAYDDTGWVSWMKPSTYVIRGYVHKSRNFGGTSGWAVDLDDDFKDGGDGRWYDPNDGNVDEGESCD